MVKSWIVCHTHTHMQSNAMHHLRIISPHSWIKFAVYGLTLTSTQVAAITSIKVAHKVSNYVGHIASRHTDFVHPSNNDGATATQANLLDVTYSGQLADGAKTKFVEDQNNNQFPCGSYTHALPAADASQVTGGIPYAEEAPPFMTGSTNTNLISNAEATTTVTATGPIGLFKTSHLDSTKVFAYCYELNSKWYDSGIRVKKTEVATLTAASGFAWTANRVQTSVWHSYNVIAREADSKMTYGGDLAAQKWVSFVDITKNNAAGSAMLVDNPCVNGAAGAESTVASGKIQGAGTGNKELTILQGTHLLDDAKSFAACYSPDDTNWYDTYIRFTVSQVSAISHKPGSWTSAGDEIEHSTFGQLPHQYANARGTEVWYHGSLADDKWISFVYDPLASGVTNQMVEHGIGYSTPCVMANAGATKDSTHSGALQATGSKTLQLDSTGLDTDLTYAVCYTHTSGTTTDANWADTGIRITFSKVHNAQLGSGYTGINPCDMTTVFQPTNVLPMVTSLVLAYCGTLTSGKYIQFVATDSANPCVPSIAGTSLSFAASPGPPSKAIEMDTSGTTVDTSKTCALCYSQTQPTLLLLATTLMLQLAVLTLHLGLIPTSGLKFPG